MSRDRAPLILATLLAAPMVGYGFVPSGQLRDGVYAVLAAGCVAVAAAGLLRGGQTAGVGRWLLVTGFLGWVVGDALTSVQERLGVTAYPAPADAAYVPAYMLMTVGLLVMVRRRSDPGRGDLTALLDAAILATGVAVVAGVFVLAPIAHDSTLSLAGKLTSGFYPVADVLLLAIVVRAWAGSRSQAPGFRLLVGALALVFAGDVYYTATTILSGSTAAALVNDFIWYAGYIALGCSTWVKWSRPGANDLPDRVELIGPGKRLVVLTAGLLLPGGTLLVEGLSGSSIDWPIIAVGSAVLSLLVLARMADLLAVGHAQSIRLAELARTDALTGIANRRTWDHELTRACERARQAPAPLSIAILDLDHFKGFNDAFGHPAGDRLLQEVAHTWRGLLDAGEVLARYGGEEFALLLPGVAPHEAEERVERLRQHTPRGQTVSAGIAAWDPEAPDSALVNAADSALYAAKRAGRDRVRVASAHSTSDLAASLQIVLQPIVDLVSGEVIAEEALSRFGEEEPFVAFRRARESGIGAELEAAAVRAARRYRRPGVLLTINVALDTLATAPMRAALAGDLRGVVLEIAEHAAVESYAVVREVIEDCRDRGAKLAIDDWPRAYSGIERLLILRPEIVKIDISMVQNLDSEDHRAAVEYLCSWGSRLDVRLCAEGIETPEQRDELIRMGVHLGQGFLLGRPARPEAAPVDDPAADPAVEARPPVPVPLVATG